MKVRADLLERLYAIHAFFFAQWRQVPLYRYPSPPPVQESLAEDEDSGSNQGSSSSSGDSKINEMYEKIMAKGEYEITSKEGEGSAEGGGGGGGTMKGLRVEKKQATTKTRRSKV